MKDKTERFLKVSLVMVSVFCVLVFSVQTIFMSLMGADAIKHLGVIYMSGMSEQVASHFGTIIELRLSQVTALVDSVPPARTVGGTPMRIELTHNARAIGFEYLALYTGDGQFHMIYGLQVTADIPEALHRSVQGGKYNVCAGKDEAGTPVVLMGVPAVYPMDDGGSSIALIAGLPVSYLSDTLESNLESSLVDYYIIRNDGSYVMQSSPVEEDNYFERIDRHYEVYGGKTPAQYAQELQEALEEDRDYTSEIMISNERWNMYCTNLPNSDWHLLLKMSHNTMDDTVDTLEKRWSFISIGGCALILGTLVLVFLGYFRLTKKQIRALDEARQSAERSSKAKNEFLSNMSHEIRTPMNGIRGMTSIALNNLDDPPQVRSCLKKINVSSRHLLGLINDMLDMSKMESRKLTLHMEPLSLRDVIQTITTVIQPQMQEKNQQFNIYIHDIRTENVCSDRVRLSQILLNILGNAVKFTPTGGAIVMELHEEPSPKGNGYIRSCLHIGDNGIGMSEEFLPNIFESFAREDSARVDRAAGAGMGLAITKFIVDAMGGTITVESEKGRGSDFYVTIDMEKALPQEPALLLPQRDVLVAGSDENAGKLVVDTLRSIGMTAEWAASLEQACQMAQAHREQGGGYDIILLDWEIQERGGIQAAQVLRRHLGENTPVLLLTNGEHDELEADAEQAGVSGLLAKPLFRSNLYYGLRRFTEVEEPQMQPAKPNGIDLAGRHVLVAEDNELNWEIAEAILSDLGMELDWAENGQICVEKFKQSAVGWYDVILMDIRMPVMTGFEAAAAIRALDREDAARIPILAISADAFADDVEKCIQCGMNGHTSKPMDVPKVLEFMNRYLSERERRP